MSASPHLHIPVRTTENDRPMPEETLERMMEARRMLASLTTELTALLAIIDRTEAPGPGGR